ncbi:hypothetical protein AN641_01890 [Candidatus Epulonipiscioides gigas]|nr:hypothetical protein AN641_01890 [Epulopiscium sp. SCG-C07WGA-EpuloA2]
MLRPIFEYASSDEWQYDFAPLNKFINETKTRVPFCDWYHTRNGKQMGFQNRTVVGTLFMKAFISQIEQVKVK